MHVPLLLWLVVPLFPNMEHCNYLLQGEAQGFGFQSPQLASSPQYAIQVLLHFLTSLTAVY